MPFFSIIIPTYNRAHILQRAIHSIITQSFRDYEIIIVDDGSTDKTKQVVHGIEDESIHYILQDNKGVCAARNAGVKHSKGSYLIFLDSDDVLFEDALIHYYQFASTGNFQIVYGDMSIINDKNQITKIVSARNPYGNHLEKGVYIPGAFCLSRDLFTQVGGYDEKIKYGENTELRFRIEVLNPLIAFVDKTVLLYKSSVDGESKNFKNLIESNLYIIKKHHAYFKKNPKVLRFYYQNIGVAFAKLKDWKSSRHYFRKAYVVNPLIVKTLLRYGIACFPYIGKKVWRT